MKFSQIKPFISLVMYSTSVISCFYYWMYNSCAVFKVFMPLMGTYFAIDLFIEPNVQYKIHHLACVYIFVYGYANQNVYRFCFYPLCIDMVFNCMNSTREYYNPVLLVNWFIICVFIAEPFDKLNHIAFHLLLNKNTYYQCLMNIHNNIQ
jgi:hypothetical protein